MGAAEPFPVTDLEALERTWASRWEEALSCWSRYTKLLAPRWCKTNADEEAEHLVGSFAMIRITDHAVVVSLRQIAARGLERFPVEILAHEIGHHVHCPGDLTDQGRLLARMRAGLPTKEHLAPFIANLYADLLINDRLARTSKLDLAGVYRTLATGKGDDLWRLYMRMYEILWSLGKGSLGGGGGSDPGALEVDAQLGARVVRVYRKDWLLGANRFAALCLPYVLEDEGSTARQMLEGLLDTAAAGEGGFPDGLTEIDDGELEGAIHPSEDPLVTGLDDVGEYDEEGAAGRQAGTGGQKKVGRYRGPIEYHELLKALGATTSEYESAIRYYRERALPHLVRFPVRESPIAGEPSPEGLETWEVGSPLERADWLESVIRSPWVVPGVTTVERVYDEAPARERAREPLWLYVGIDCSGSMPNPVQALSFPVLAGTILAMSALRAGGRVKVVLSGEPGRSLSTDGFVSTEHAALSVLTRYLGTGTAFGIHRLAETFPDGGAPGRPTHVVVITDQDIFGMLDGRTKGSADTGWTIARSALATARGGGTYVLHMPSAWKDADVEKMGADGWDVHRLYDWEELVAFARAFSARSWGREIELDGHASHAPNG